MLLLRRAVSQKYKNENVNIIIRSLEADKFGQVKYLRSSVVLGYRKRNIRVKYTIG